MGQFFSFRRGRFFILLAGLSLLARAQVSFTGGTYAENFDAATPTQLPAGWFFAEAGNNADDAFAVGTGTSNSGNTYLLGSGGDYCLGGLQSGSLQPSIGFAFVNDTGAPMTSVAITFTGKTWRVGATGRVDRLDFQYSTDATSLTTGSWVNFDALDYANNPALAMGGGSVQHSAHVTASIPLTVPAGATVFFRWIDFNAVGADDAMGIDDFSLSAGGSAKTARAPAAPNSAPASVPSAPAAPLTLTKISAVQGKTGASPLVDQIVMIRGVVTGFFQGSAGSREGFYLQEEDADVDSDPATSEGIYVYAGRTSTHSSTVAALKLGDLVTAVGKVAEFNMLTQLTTDGVVEASVQPAGTAPLPAAAAISLPVSELADLEHVENMRVQFPQTLTVTGNHTLGQYGELHLSGRGLIYQPTNVIDPNDVPATGTNSTGANNVAAITALQQANRLSVVVLDDANSKTYPDPTPYLNAAGTRRIGDTVTGLAGVLTYRFNFYRIDPQGPVVFTDRNPRPVAAPDLGARSKLKVASANVLNYFTTLGRAGRGASSQAEFERQKTKIIASLATLNADIIGLMEIERRSDNAALADLVAGLNARLGAGTYAYVDSSALAGTDAIQLALIYKPATVSPAGAPQTDTSPAASVFNRPPLAQTFAVTATGAKFTVVVNHFKSKGGAGTGADADQGDGQSAHNATRKKQAAALAAFLATPAATFGDPDVLIIGDLNAYAEEDPVDVLRAAGYTDLLQIFRPGGHSYQYGSQLGYLDHALASPSLRTQVTGADHWHINADEPSYFDYNLENKSPAQQAINVDTPYRSSDHDPVVIGLALAPGAGSSL